MQSKIELPFFSLLLLISFASINAVLFTPALPDIAKFFTVSAGTAQLTITWFLIGYALGQLIYGPIANRFGRKPAIYVGIFIQILSSFLCVSAGFFHDFSLLIFGRFMLALGSGVGLKMTFTLVNECYEAKIASQKIAYLMLAFAITPGLGIALGGVLNSHFGWTSCFYAGAVYGFILFLLLIKLPETQKILDLDAFKANHLFTSYAVPFKNSQLTLGALVMGCFASFVYAFSAMAPFIAINLFHMSSVDYGFANLIPPIGLIAGSLCSARLIKVFSLQFIIQLGIVISCLGGIFMAIAMGMNCSVIISLFIPMAIIYIGLSFILANMSVLAMSQVSDKAHGSAVMNFINVGIATLVVLGLGFFSVKELVLPILIIVLCGIMMGIYKLRQRKI